MISDINIYRREEDGDSRLCLDDWITQQLSHNRYLIVILLNGNALLSISPSLRKARDNDF
jgi:hypothetical protein